MLFTTAKVEMFPQPIQGIVEEAIAPDRPGRVKCDCTCWPARFYQSIHQKTISPGELVVVVGIQGITLLVD